MFIIYNFNNYIMSRRRETQMRLIQPTQKLRTRDVEEIIRQHGRIGETGVALSLGKAGNRRRTHRLNMHRKPKKKVELEEGAIEEGALEEGAIEEGAIGEGRKRRRVDLIRWFGYIHCNRIICVGYAIK
jgi:hypothetical protein